MDGQRFDTIAMKIAGQRQGERRGTVLSGLAARLHRRRLFRGGAAALAVLGLGLGRAKEASAQSSVVFCNHTAEEVWVAISYNENKGVWCTDNWWTEGWWQLAACGGCATVYAGELGSSFFYYHAYSDTGAWQGEFYAYVSDSVFGTCEAQGSALPGAHQVGFRETNVGGSAKRINLGNPDGYTGSVCIDHGTNLNPVNE